MKQYIVDAFFFLLKMLLLEGKSPNNPTPDWKGGRARPPEAGRSGSVALESGWRKAIFGRVSQGIKW